MLALEVLYPASLPCLKTGQTLPKQERIHGLHQQVVLNTGYTYLHRIWIPRHLSDSDRPPLSKTGVSYLRYLEKKAATTCGDSWKRSFSIVESSDPYGSIKCTSELCCVERHFDPFFHSDPMLVLGVIRVRAITAQPSMLNGVKMSGTEVERAKDSKVKGASRDGPCDPQVPAW